MPVGGKRKGEGEAVARATAIQLEAARPDLSVVLKAGAGSGKTHALINRFLRLCIEWPRRDTERDDEAPEAVPVHPRSILAITFTRKAAVEIRERLLRQAVDLSTLEGEALAGRLQALLGRRPQEREKKRAAGLYTQILEHPQGLKIGTIHHFCQMILGRFALEAGLDPGYTVVEDTAELEEEALDEMEKVLALDDDLATTARRLGKDPAAIRLSLRRVFNGRMRLERWAARLAGEQEQEGGDLAHLAPVMAAELKAILFPHLGPQEEPDLGDLLEDLAGALEKFAGPGMDEVLQTLGDEAGNLTATSKTKVRTQARSAAEACGQAAARVGSADGPAARAAAEQTAAQAVTQARQVLLTKSGTVRKFSQGKKFPDLNARYEELVMTAGAGILDLARRIELRTLYRKNAAFLQLGLRTLDIYQGLKRRDRAVDFQDLEGWARRLMGDEARALSLLFRLDDSITHIMVDEFQDTNANQYDILRPLSDDFLAGGSGQTALPTVFFVGDVKQSIYGFRGAEPRIFRSLCASAESWAGTDESAAAGGVEVLTLPTNFRSLPAVVHGVGELFFHPPLAADLGVNDPEDLVQMGRRDEAPGLLCVMPPFEPPEGGRDGGDLLAAEAAATLVRRLVDGGETTWEKDGTPRPLRWSDVLVLFRSRTRVGIYEDAFRRRLIPINPSGRGALASTREVQDLLALLRWLVWPEDDVALATVLRSPLFRLSQHELQETLARRGILDERPGGEGYKTPRGLWETIRGEKDHPVTGRAATLLGRWRRRSGYESCHDLIRRIFREGEMPARYRAALGEQAVYNLERIHDLTLGRDLASMPTVRRLVRLLERAERRGGQEEGIVPETAEGGRVRFMTIHGAKGLEAPVVLLVDADAASNKEDAQVILDPDDSCSALLYVARKQERQGPAVATGTADPVSIGAQAARGRERREEANLQYVAMTRARDRLYILGGDKGNDKSEHDSPLRRILASAADADSRWIEVGLPAEVEGTSANESAGLQGDESSSGQDAGSLPGLMTWQPPVMRERIRILTPSAAEGPEEVPTAKPPVRGGHGDGSAGLERGLQVHSLLEAAARGGRMPPGEGPSWQEARTVFEEPSLAWIFRPEQEGGRGLSEVPVIAERAAVAEDGIRERITGVVDRLVLRPGRVDIIDYKTNRGAQDMALQQALVEHYRPQLVRYREVLEMIYPAREIRTWLLFTDPDLAAGRRLVEVE